MRDRHLIEGRPRLSDGCALIDVRQEAVGVIPRTAIHVGWLQCNEPGQVLIFGSRAKGNSKSGSDIDLALKGLDVTDKTIARLRTMLNDLPLPFFFDIVDYKTIQNQDLISHIDRVGEIIYQKNI